jgi:hypothetical protein
MTEEAKRIVPLEDDQFDRLWQDYRARDLVTTTLANLIMELCERKAEQESDMWGTVYRLAGVDRTKEGVKIDWINRCIVVTERMQS